jgi:uncharacterized protein (DUF433 family)
MTVPYLAGDWTMIADAAHPHIEKTNGDAARLRRLPRIRVAQIAIDHINHGWSADEICLHYPHLKLAEVHSALAYYFDHQTEIDGEIAAEQRAIDEAYRNAKPSPAELRLRAEGRLPKK